MKIAIVTLIGEFNYGNLLQSYALQSVLEQMGHNVVILNRREPKPSLKLLTIRIMSIFKSIIRRYILGNKEFLIVNPLAEDYCVKNRVDCYKLKDFAANYLNRTLPIRSLCEMRKYIQNEHFDAYIVGSDQVWREDYTFSIEEMFLSFLHDGCTAKRIAYAASFGTDDKPISSEKLYVCSKLLKQFNAVSVREKSAVGICKKMFGVESVHLLDPTMLLNIDKYKNIFKKANTPKASGTLLTYILDEDENIKIKIGKFAKEQNLIPFSVNVIEKSGSISYTYCKPSIEAWLRGFYDAEFIITDSFHACVFSIIFNKPFICLGNKWRGNTRFDSLLHMFGLQDRLVDDMDVNPILYRTIDWEKVNEVLEQKRKESIDFLRIAL